MCSWHQALPTWSARTPPGQYFRTSIHLPYLPSHGQPSLELERLAALWQGHESPRPAKQRFSGALLCQSGPWGLAKQLLCRVRRVQCWEEPDKKKRPETAFLKGKFWRAAPCSPRGAVAPFPPRRPLARKENKMHSTRVCTTSLACIQAKERR